MTACSPPTWRSACAISVPDRLAEWLPGASASPLPSNPPTVQPLPWRDPLGVFRAAAALEDAAFLLSRGAAGPRARYSYLCFSPRIVLRQQNGQITANNIPIDGDMFAALRKSLAGGRRDASPVPFAGGAAGFFSYEAGAALERVRHPAGGFPALPEAQFGIYDKLVAWDHAARACWLIGASPQDMPFPWRDAAESAAPRLDWQAEASAALHQARIAQCIALIRAGDIFQANITLPFTASLPVGVTPAACFAVLAAANPAPFSAYLPCGPHQAIASVSPERFVSLSAGDVLETRPIKGTAARHADPSRDAALAQALAASGKDRAENLMIVDLMRNDLARIAEPGSVRVPALCALESFASVHHLVSAVTARLAPGRDALDVLRAALPAGSITGAPKIRAMQIIAELEPAPRGAYCGTAAWIGYDGAMDSSVLIRTASIAQGSIIVQAGGGITAESDPEAEWQEAMTKMRPMLRAFGCDRF